MNGFIKSIDEIINEGNLGTQINSEQIYPHVITAEIELKRLLGDNYNIYSGYENSTNDNEKLIYEEIQKAAYNLALSYAVHALNIETQGSGIIRSKGFDVSRSELLSREEIKDLSEHFRSIAMKLLEPYLPRLVNDEDIQDQINLSNLDMSVI